MFESIDSYLNALKAALKGSDPALVQDALWDAENHLKNGVAAFLERHPGASPSDALNAVIKSYGTPEEVAEAYLERETVVQHALRPISEKVASNEAVAQPSSDWPGLLQVLWTPSAYTSVLYLLMALPVGIFFFTWAVTGISLSVGLMPLIIGIPFAIAFLGSVRLLSLAEGRLVEALLDVRMPRRPRLLPEGEGWLQKLKNLFLDGHTWSSLAYMLLHLPLGIFYFTMIITGLSLSLGLVAAPIAHWIFGLPVYSFDTGYMHYAAPGWLIAISPLFGFAVLILVLHFALLLGRLQRVMAKHMLVQR